MKNDTLVLMLSTALLFAVSAGSATTTELSQASESDEIDYGKLVVVRKSTIIAFSL